jgi:hypothetical protein
MQTELRSFGWQYHNITVQHEFVGFGQDSGQRNRSKCTSLVQLDFVIVILISTNAC